MNNSKISSSKQLYRGLSVIYLNNLELTLVFRICMLLMYSFLKKFDVSKLC